MISPDVNPQLAASQTEKQDLIRFKQQMDGLKERLSGGKDQEKQLRKACQNFEAVFITKLWQQMRQSVQKEGYLHSKQEDTYLSMFDKDFSEKMADAGGIGLADMIYGQLSEKLKSTSKTTMGGAVDIRPIKSEPVALKLKDKAIPLEQNKGMTLEDWGGTQPTESMGSSAPPVSEEADKAASTSGVMSDMEVQAKLEALSRRLEAERIQNGLAGAARSGGNEYGSTTSETVGRNLAKIG